MIDKLRHLVKWVKAKMDAAGPGASFAVLMALAVAAGVAYDLIRTFVP